MKRPQDHESTLDTNRILFHRRNLPHFDPQGKAVFVTFRTEGQFVLPEKARELVLKHCLHDHQKGIFVDCAIVMPDHVHLLFHQLEDSCGQFPAISKIMNGIKGASAHSVNRLLSRSGALWQDESYDHVLRSSENLEKVVEYICQNPVRRALVTEQDEYRWLWKAWNHDTEK